MKKPHEQDWKWYESGSQNFGVSLMGVTRGGFKQATIGSRMSQESAQFIAAAPDMARALMVVLESGVNATWEREDGTRVDLAKSARAALRKAGVLP